MRYLVLALMIALLPLRGWVGDVMATEMASGGAVHQVTEPEIAIETIASHAHAAGAEGHFDNESAAPEQMASLTDCAGHGSDDDHTAAGGHCESCAACQACHTVALSPVTAVASAALTPFAAPLSPVARFASADATQGQKPPIS